MMLTLLHDEAPVDLTAGTTERWIFTMVVFALAIAVTAYLLRGQRGSELKLRCLVLLGGALTILYEPLAEYLGGYWSARNNQWVLFQQYGHDIPLWHLPVYYLFLGGFTFMVFDAMRKGARPRTFWRMYAFFFALNCAIEIPSVQFTNLARYYGDQPFRVLGFPLWYPAINGVWPIVLAGMVTLLVSRKLYWMIPFGIVSSAFATYAATAWPTWAALNAEVSPLVTHTAGALTIVFCLLLAHLVIRCVEPTQRLAEPGGRRDAPESVAGGRH